LGLGPGAATPPAAGDSDQGLAPAPLPPARPPGLNPSATTASWLLNAPRPDAGMTPAEAWGGAPTPLAPTPWSLASSPGARIPPQYGAPMPPAPAPAPVPPSVQPVPQPPTPWGVPATVMQPPAPAQRPFPTHLFATGNPLGPGYPGPGPNTPQLMPPGSVPLPPSRSAAFPRGVPAALPPPAATAGPSHLNPTAQVPAAAAPALNPNPTRPVQSPATPYPIAHVQGPAFLRNFILAGRAPPTGAGPSVGSTMAGMLGTPYGGAGQGGGRN